LAYILDSCRSARLQHRRNHLGWQTALPDCRHQTSGDDMNRIEAYERIAALHYTMLMMRLGVKRH
jgi:hypothetical protein